MTEGPPGPKINPGTLSDPADGRRCSAACTDLRARDGGSQARGVDVHCWRGNREAPVAFEDYAGADDRQANQAPGLVEAKDVALGRLVGVGGRTTVLLRDSGDREAPGRASSVQTVTEGWRIPGNDRAR